MVAVGSPTTTTMRCSSIFNSGDGRSDAKTDRNDNKLSSSSSAGSVTSSALAATAVGLHSDPYRRHVQEVRDFFAPENGDIGAYMSVGDGVEGGVVGGGGGSDDGHADSDSNAGADVAAPLQLELTSVGGWSHFLRDGSTPTAITTSASATTASRSRSISRSSGSGGSGGGRRKAPLAKLSAVAPAPPGYCDDNNTISKESNNSSCNELDSEAVVSFKMSIKLKSATAEAAAEELPSTSPTGEAPPLERDETATAQYFAAFASASDTNTKNTNANTIANTNAVANTNANTNSSVKMYSFD